MINRGLDLEDQIEKGIGFAKTKYRAEKYIAYFQAFTNTYGPVSRLREIYQSALNHKGMVGLSIGTRPDCIDHDILDLISSFQKDCLVWIEYGLQSAHDATLSRINRGHDAACFEKAVHMTKEYGINVCAHVILGLPGEDHDMMMDTARFVAALPIDGIKIHSLYVTKGTALADLYRHGEYTCIEREEYIETLIDFLELLPPEMVIQRLTGDPDPTELLAPQWTREKTLNLMLINNRMEERDTWQGKEIQEIHCCIIEADRLRIYLASSEKGAMRVGLLLDKGPYSLDYFKKVFPDAILIEDRELNYPLIEAVNTALVGKKPPEGLKTDINHTPFQMKAWKAIRKIPFGETRTYREVAIMAGCPKGARAIGQAMHRNPLPLIFPCHRVVAANGLGGFSGGLELKRYLLNKENKTP